ncbi:MAG TPA: glycosyl hydrolase, partial [Chloroflexota bacterium]
MAEHTGTSEPSIQDKLTTADRLDGLKYRNIGPHRGGRVVAVAGHPHDPMVFYFGACAGGIWKTVDGGTFWECVSDGFLNTAAVGAIAVSESDSNVLYAGSGETTIRGDVSHGDGVYKSTDAGKTWTNVGLAATRHIAKIRIHPHNPDLVYVAALGHAWGANDERGLYRSKDGGATWEQILFRSNTAGAIDLSMDPNNPRILYCSFWEAQRTPYSMWSGGPGSSLYRSTDGGDTWTDISRNQGLPKGVLGKIGVAVSPARPDRVWALIEAEDGALCRSDDGGETWQRISENDDLRRRAWYYMHVFADPQDANVVWVLNLSCWKSIDGGANFTGVATPHGDNHDLWIDPNDTRRLIEGNDGGACVSFNGGNSWSTILNQPTAQFYHVTADTQVPYRVYGSQQDNTAISVAGRSVHGVITETDWLVPGGGESGYIAVRPDAPYIQYAGDHRGFLTRTDQRTGQERVVDVWPEYFGMYEGADALKHRFQWTFPLFLSPFDPQVLYAAGECLFRSTDEGSSWEAISPDLTRHDAGTLKTSGGPITLDNTSAEVYATIFSAVESPHERGMFWVGTDDGLVHISRDGGTSWADITPPELKLPNGEWALISIIDLSAHDAATAYLAATRYKLDDVRPYLYKTNDFGASWTKITNGIPEDDFTRVIRADPECPVLLYAGTETGLYISFDDGERWERFQSNLPVCPIHDLIVHDHDLLVATHGRSFWILDDVTPLRELARDRATAPRLFQPRDTIRFQVYRGFGEGEGAEVSYRMAGPVTYAYKQREKSDGTKDIKLLNAGQNPPDGVLIAYELAEPVAGELTVTILDGDDREIRRFSSTRAKQPDENRDQDTESGPGAERTDAAEVGEGSEVLADAEEDIEGQKPFLSTEAG